MKRYIVAIALLTLVGVAGLSTATFAAGCCCKPSVTSQPLDLHDLTP